MRCLRMILLAVVAQVVVTQPLGAPPVQEVSLTLHHTETGLQFEGERSAVPVIHLPMIDSGKAPSDHILDMFPRDLLMSRKRIKPMNLHMIEHKDFIDYEIEFIELSEEEINDPEERDNLVTSAGGEDVSDNTAAGEDSGVNSNKMSLDTFVDLLRRARIRHQTKISGDRRWRRRIKLKRPVTGESKTDNLVELETRQKLQLSLGVKSQLRRKPVQLLQERRQGGETETQNNGGGGECEEQRRRGVEGKGKRRRVGGEDERRRRVVTEEEKKRGGVDEERPRQSLGRRLGLVSVVGRRGGGRSRKRVPLARKIGRKFRAGAGRHKLRRSTTEQPGTVTMVTTSSSSLPTEETSTTMMYPAFLSTASTNSVERILPRAPPVFFPLTDIFSIFGNQPKTQQLRLEPIQTHNTDRGPFSPIFLIETSTTAEITTVLPSTASTSTTTTTMSTTASTTIITTIDSTTTTTTVPTTASSTTPTTTTTVSTTTATTRTTTTLATITPTTTLTATTELITAITTTITTIPNTTTFTTTEYTTQYPMIRISPWVEATSSSVKEREESTLSPELQEDPTTEPLLYLVTRISHSHSHSYSTSLPVIIPAWVQGVKEEDTLVAVSVDDTPTSVLVNERDDTVVSVKKDSKISLSVKWEDDTHHVSIPVKVTDDTLSLISMNTGDDTPAPVSVNEQDTVLSPEDLEPSQSMSLLQFHSSLVESSTLSSLTSSETVRETGLAPPTADRRTTSPPPNTWTTPSTQPTVWWTLPTVVDRVNTLPHRIIESHNTQPDTAIEDVSTTLSPTIIENISTTSPPITIKTTTTTYLPTSTIPALRRLFIVTGQPVPVTTTTTVTTTHPPPSTTELEEFTTETSVPLDILYSGQYHEINPGQYTETNPGQYHEVNPGQYTESHHGQAGGQFRNWEKNYSEDYEVNDVKVDFNHDAEHKIYTVEAKAGDFIIGEVGRIDINNGQTLEGVRYTALNGEVSQKRIIQILERFFGAWPSS